jgi:hypothetical protein
LTPCFALSIFLQKSQKNASISANFFNFATLEFQEIACEGAAVLMEEDIKQEFISYSDGETEQNSFDVSVIISEGDISNENLHSTTIGKPVLTS